MNESIATANYYIARTKKMQSQIWMHKNGYEYFGNALTDIAIEFILQKNAHSELVNIFQCMDNMWKNPDPDLHIHSLLYDEKENSIHIVLCTYTLNRVALLHAEKTVKSFKDYLSLDNSSSVRWTRLFDKDNGIIRNRNKSKLLLYLGYFESESDDTLYSLATEMNFALLCPPT